MTTAKMAKEIQQRQKVSKLYKPTIIRANVIFLSKSRQNYINSLDFLVTPYEVHNT